MKVKIETKPIRELGLYTFRTHHIYVCFTHLKHIESTLYNHMFSYECEKRPYISIFIIKLFDKPTHSC